jgi:MFS family permease
MLINLALGVFILMLVLLFTKDFPKGFSEEKTNISASIPFWKGFVMVIKNPQNWFAGAYIGLLNLAVLLLGAIWGTNYLMIRNPGHSAEVITSVIGMIFIGTMIGSPLFGWLSDRLKNRKWVMVAAASLSLLVMFMIMIIPDMPAALLYVLFLFLGLITAAQTIGYPVIAESNEEKLIGTANGFGAVLIMGMAAIAQPLFGSLIRLFGGETTDSYEKAIWLMPVSFAIALLCALILKETFRKS